MPFLSEPQFLGTASARGRREFLAQAIGAGCQPSRRETESSRRGRGDGQLS